jgi:hypothetical protein
MQHFSYTLLSCLTKTAVLQYVVVRVFVSESLTDKKGLPGDGVNERRITS